MWLGAPVSDVRFRCSDGRLIAPEVEFFMVPPSVAKYCIPSAQAEYEGAAVRRRAFFAKVTIPPAWGGRLDVVASFWTPLPLGRPYGQSPSLLWNKANARVSLQGTENGCGDRKMWPLP
jgi:hypothetical protein